MRRLASNWGLVCPIFLGVVGTAAPACAQDPVQQQPDTLSKVMVRGTYIWAQGSAYTELQIKNNNTCCWKKKSYGKSQPDLKGQWEIKNDTLFITADGVPARDKLVMHRGTLYLLPRSGNGKPQPGMTKQEYKYYQKQCRETGN